MVKEAALTLVNTKIKENKVVVFSKTYCPYCIKAKKALTSLIKPEQMEVVEIDGMSHGEGIDVQDALYEVTGGRSVPRVFIGGKFIGGGDDTAAALASGQLAQLLSAVGLP
ncbi:GRXC3 [Scenedesmus sp. PABB004]|nr:GRXC3 [Scenedesmus sp. PABB004]